MVSQNPLLSNSFTKKVDDDSLVTISLQLGTKQRRLAHQPPNIIRISRPYLMLIWRCHPMPKSQALLVLRLGPSANG